MTLRNGEECVCGQVSTCYDQSSVQATTCAGQSMSCATPTAAAEAARKVVESRVLKTLQPAGAISRSRISNGKELQKKKSTTSISEPLQKRVRIQDEGTT